MKINIQNYEEWMIDYVEGNLSPAQQREFAEFLEFHPELKAELELFRQTKLEPDTKIVFEGKEKLLKKETARVITLGSWVKYASAAAAAVIVIFIGISQFKSGDEQLSIKQYNAIDTGNGFAYERKTDSTDENAQKEVVVKQAVHQYAEIEKPQEKKTPEQKILREENFVIEKIETAEIKPIEMQQPGLEIINKSESAVMNQAYAQNNQTDHSKYISLNDNNSIVDWMNDAVAVGGEVGGLLESFILKDEKTEEVSDSPYKTTSVNIFGLSYYSRKKSN